MPSHRQRLLAITIMLGICLVGLIVCLALGITEGTGFGVFAGACTLLLTAFLDASAVERRRLDPGLSALSDDVRKDAGEANSGASG